jgi:cytochrome P450 family 6
MNSQASVFLLAGYETTNQTLSLCLYEIVKNPEVQEKIYEEIDNAMFWSNDKILSYEMVDQMRYLDCCVEETLRKYAILPIVIRLAKNDYKVSDDITIPAGTSLLIPSLGFHRDPKIYEDPLQFKPERFLGSSNGKNNSKGLSHLPFGAGPRNCIGADMGKIIVKIALVLIISKFHLKFKDPQLAKEEMKLKPNKVFSTPVKNIDLELSFR